VSKCEKVFGKTSFIFKRKKYIKGEEREKKFQKDQ